MQGKQLRHAIENMQQIVRENGTPTIVDGMGTIEILNYNFTISYNCPINLIDIREEMINYYSQNSLDLEAISKLEADEYTEIENKLIDKFSFFDKDIHSRRVLWSSDCCISLIHFLIRNKVINCYVHLRSSDVVNKLFSDLMLIHKITKQLQEKTGINNVIMHINGHSFHEIIMNVNK